jgi:hypothetical protein
MHQTLTRGRRSRQQKSRDNDHAHLIRGDESRLDTSAVNSSGQSKRSVYVLRKNFVDAVFELAE